jgi:acetyl esterase
MPVDTATQALLAKVAAAATKPRQDMSVAEAREAMRALTAALALGAAMAQIRDFTIPIDGAMLPARLYQPPGALGGLLVYYHGGGWVVGSIVEYDTLCRELAVRSGCAVVSVEYRRAPEHPYPGPVDDADAALQWVSTHRQDLPGAALPLLIGGDSAGANLAMALTLRRRDRTAPTLAGQLLIYPVADCDFCRPSYRAPENQLLLTREAMMWYWDHYLPDPARRSEPDASPLRAFDHAGLPPAVILTAEYDVLRDEGEAYVAALQQAGVDVNHHRFAGQIHGFLMMAGLLPGSAVGLEFAGQALRRLLTKTE